MSKIIDFIVIWVVLITPIALALRILTYLNGIVYNIWVIGTIFLGVGLSFTALRRWRDLQRLDKEVNSNG